MTAPSDDLAGQLAAVVAELEQVRQQLAAAQRPHRLRVSRIGAHAPERARLVLRSVESDPDTQYKIHRWGAVYWLLNFPVIIWLFLFHQDLWLKVGIFITLIYSIYANLATDYGAMSSAMAAKGMQQPLEAKVPPEA